ncbi:glycogen synthase GlgA [bacterium]|nr:glycogen synthase GlgA [bacterium]
MNILIAASECVPFAKTGGLADVTGALPKALKELKHDVRVIMPRYKKIDAKKFNLKVIARNIPVSFGNKVELATVMEGKINSKSSIPVYFVDNEKYYNRDELYRTSLGDYSDNGERFIFFSRAVLEVAKAINFKPDVIHCNDWQTGLIPAYLKTLYKLDPFFLRTAVLYTIHNIAYQGVFPRDIFYLAGFDWEDFIPQRLEYYGQINFMKAGLVYAEGLNTVSKTYSRQIQTSEEFGRGMEGVLVQRKKDLYGIINGLDYSIWNPKQDQNIIVQYSLDDLEGKTTCKKDLQKISGLPIAPDIPLIGLVARLDAQKGLDILHEAIGRMMRMKLQLIILGTGDPVYMELFERIGKKYPRQISVNLKFDNALAHKIYAGSDMFLIPSHFEPCGLGQLISFVYGTIPVVHKTGGLSDTVDSFNVRTGKGRGFLFNEYNAKSLFESIKKAVKIYKIKKKWNRLIKNGMESDFSWEKAAKSYVRLYKKAQQEKIKETEQ